MAKFAIRRYERTLCGFEWFYTGTVVEADSKEQAVSQYAGGLALGPRHVQAVPLDEAAPESKCEICGQPQPGSHLYEICVADGEEGR